MTIKPKKLILISPHGFCAGVERAVQIAERMLRTSPHPVYCLKEIVHNHQIIDDLSAMGMVFVQEINEVPRGASLLFSAHGIPPSIRKSARRLGLNTVDATCPFVTKVHLEVKQFAKRDFTILLIGHHTHDEILGVAGEAPDHVKVVATEAEARQVVVKDPGKVAVLTQTTLSIDEVSHLMAILRDRFPSLKTPSGEDICYATRNRQQAVRLFASQADAVIVLGAETSSNSNRLVEVARAGGCPAYLASSIDKLATLPLTTIATLGITAGASTPESFVREAIAYLQEQGFTSVEESVLIKEDIHFSLPKELESEDRTG